MALINDRQLIIEHVPLLATCSAAIWWLTKLSKLSTNPANEFVCEQMMDLLHNGGCESVLIGFITWLSWIFVVFRITGVDAKHPPDMLANVIFSTAHCIIAIYVGWFYVYEPDWSLNHENRRSSALFCGFSMTYMFADLYFMLCTGLPYNLEIVIHHCICITGIFYALTSTHMTQLADTIIIYESTGFMFNMQHLFEHFKVSERHWLFLLNGFAFVIAFTYFRIYLGSALAFHFIYDDKVESSMFLLIATLFHSISIYWYYLIISKVVSVTYKLLR